MKTHKVVAVLVALSLVCTVTVGDTSTSPEVSEPTSASTESTPEEIEPTSEGPDTTSTTEPTSSVATTTASTTAEITITTATEPPTTPQPPTTTITTTTTTTPVETTAGDTTKPQSSPAPTVSTTEGNTETQTTNDTISDSNFTTAFPIIKCHTCEDCSELEKEENGTDPEECESFDNTCWMTYTLETETGTRNCDVETLECNKEYPETNTATDGVCTYCCRGEFCNNHTLSGENCEMPAEPDTGSPQAGSLNILLTGILLALVLTSSGTI